jgi:hypothetical protein
LRPSRSLSSLSPWTIRSPRFTCVSELKAPPALAHRLARELYLFACHDTLHLLCCPGCEDSATKNPPSAGSAGSGMDQMRRRQNAITPPSRAAKSPARITTQRAQPPKARTSGADALSGNDAYNATMMTNPCAASSNEGRAYSAQSHASSRQVSERRKCGPPHRRPHLRSRPCAPRGQTSGGIYRASR